MRTARITPLVLLVLVSAALLGALALAGCGSGSSAVSGPTVTLAKVLRGRYLVTAVVGCADCHSPGKGPGDAGWLEGYVAGTPGQPFSVGPYSIYPDNLTPDSTGLGSWTPQQIFDALRHGQDDTGRYLAPPMPTAFRLLTDDDIWAIVAYLRSIKPVSNTVPANQGDWSSMHTNLPPLPAYPAASETLVSASQRAQVLHGRYLVTAAASCADCHSPGKDPGSAGWLGGYVPGTPGQPFQIGPFNTYPANLTPDATGLKSWTTQQIFNAFRLGKDNTGRYLCPPMPAPDYRFMTNQDISDIVAYLQSIKAVSNTVPASQGDWSSIYAHLQPLPQFPAASEVWPPQ